LPGELDLQLLLLFANISIYSVLGLGLIVLRIIRPPKVSDMREAFELLASSVDVAIPSLPAGYTWREALPEIKKKLKTEDWTVIEQKLAEYELFRFGGGEMPREGKEAVARLAIRLRRT